MEEFNKYFEVILADTEELKDTVFKLRYTILVEQYGFKCAGDRHTLMDTDQYDNAAFLYLIRYKPTNDFVATMRIVYPAAINNYRLPFEQYCKFYGNVTWDIPGRKNIIEVSRISVSKALKQELRLNDRVHKASTKLSNVMFACAINAATQINRDFIVGSVSPAWSRVIKKSGFEHVQIGPDVDYDGYRHPIVVDVKQVLETAKFKNPELYNLICGSIVKFPNVQQTLNNGNT